MRDPKRIDKVLNTIKEVWEECPDLRLLQLLINCIGEQHPLFSIEDDHLEKHLKQYGGKIEYHKPKL